MPIKEERIKHTDQQLIIHIYLQQININNNCNSSVHTRLEDPKHLRDIH